VARATYSKAGGSGQLVLLRRPLEIPPLIDVLLERTRGNGRGNVAYLLIDAQGRQPLTGNLLGVIYLTEAEPNEVRPETWKAQVAWSPARGEAYVVLGRYRDVTLWLSVYTFRPHASVGHYPRDLNREDADNWPSGTEPVTTFHKATVSDLACGLADLGVMTRGDALDTMVQPSNPQCTPISLEYNFASGMWSERTTATPAVKG